jgi:hypothetical protein
MPIRRVSGAREISPRLAKLELRASEGDAASMATLAYMYRYGKDVRIDKVGPTVPWLLAQGKTWAQIIESSMRTGGGRYGF